MGAGQFATARRVTAAEMLPDIRRLTMKGLSPSMVSRLLGLCEVDVRSVTSLPGASALLPEPPKRIEFRPEDLPRYRRKKPPKVYTRVISPEWTVRPMPDEIRALIVSTCIEHGASSEDVMGKSPKRSVALVRHACFYRIYALRNEMGFRRFSTPQIGRWFQRDHSSVLSGIRNHAQACNGEA